MPWYQRLPLQVRFLVPVSILIGALVLGGAWWFAQAEEARITGDVKTAVEQQRTSTVGLLAVIDALVTSQVQGTMAVLREHAARRGAPRLGARVAVGERTAPDLLLGADSVANRYALVDEVTGLLGGTATLFVRDGEDFVRVSTNVTTQGKRAVGTVLDPNGAAMAALRDGKAFYGLVDILGAPYITGYEPMRDATGAVIGVWYVGYALDMRELADRVRESRVLESGFLAVLDRKDKVRFHSGHVDPERVGTLTAGSDGWAVEPSEFAAWGYRVVSAYPRAEVQALVDARFQQVVMAGLVGWAFLVALLGVIVRQLVVRPLGGEPAYAREVARRIAQGELAEGVRVRAGDQDSVLAAMKAAQDSVQAMAEDTQRLVESAIAGRLTARADASRHRGDYRRIVEGVNATLDAVIGPLEAAAQCVDRIGRGEIPAPITAEYAGEFNALRDNLNACIRAVRALVDDADLLARAAVEGDLSRRADAGRHRGDYARIVAGVNSTLDAVIGPVEQVKAVMQAIAGGNLSQRVDGEYHGDFAVLQQAVNASIDRLGELVGGIKASAGTIDSAAHEIAAGNTNLASRTEEQAAQLEETAASMAEITRTVAQNADHSRHAMQLARDASEVAARGGTKVRAVVETMDAITRGSREIAEIVGVIDGIAFQTNILALNAAVEAARAGEQGRGFAVVSGEVRTLAQRSATAAREIRALIQTSVETVGGGARLVAEAGATMDEIVSSVDRVTALVGEISVASEQQARGIEQVGAAVAQMDSTTQQNAALVEESAAAAVALEQQARTLASAVAAFRMEAGAAPATAARRVRACA